MRAERELQLHAQEGQPLQVVGMGKRSSVNYAQATRLDQLGDRRLSGIVIPGDKDIEGLAGHLTLDQRPGKGGIERLDHAGRCRDKAGNLLRG